jgi:hypothetical protein
MACPLPATRWRPVGASLAEPAAWGLAVLGDKNCLGEDCIRAPVPRHVQAGSPKGKPTGAQAGAAPWGRVNAQLNFGHILRKFRCCLGVPGSWLR